MHMFGSPLYVATFAIKLFLVAAFLLDLVVRFRTRRGPIFLLWLGVWSSISANHIFNYSDLLLDYMDHTDAADVLQVSSRFADAASGAFLLVLSELLKVSEASERSLWIVFLKWGIPCLAAAIIESVLFFRLGLFLHMFLGFLALAFYSGRFEAAFPSAPQWIPLVLYMYAGRALVQPAAYGVQDHSVVLPWLVSGIPLAIVLYYTSYFTLQYTAAGLMPQIKGMDSATIEDKSNGPKIGNESLPGTSIQIQLTGLWGFLFMLWKYPSGRLVILFTVAAVFSVAAFLLATSDKLIELISLVWKLPPSDP